MWSLKGTLSLIDIGNAHYVARFSNADDYIHVLSEGPWMIGDNYLVIRRWMPNFDPFSDKTKVLTAWIRIPGLSLEYFHGGFLKRLGSLIGKVTKVDATTLKADRGQFVRLAVEVDLAKPILYKFRFMGRTWPIQYEGIRMMCYHCAKVGHSQDNCPLNPDKNSETDAAAKVSKHPAVVPDGIGVWNKVVKGRRGNNSTKKSQGQKHQAEGTCNETGREETSGSRFAALELETANEQDGVEGQRTDQGSSPVVVAKRPVIENAGTLPTLSSAEIQLETTNQEGVVEIPDSIAEKVSTDADLVGQGSNLGKSHDLASLNQVKNLHNQGLPKDYSFENQKGRKKKDNRNIGLSLQKSTGRIASRPTIVSRESVVRTAHLISESLDSNTQTIPTYVTSKVKENSSSTPTRKNESSKSAAGIVDSSIQIYHQSNDLQQQNRTFHGGPASTSPQDKARDLAYGHGHHAGAVPGGGPTTFNDAVGRLLEAYRASAFQGTATSMGTILKALFPMKNINILFWNSRGAGGAPFLTAIRELIRTHDPSVIALVETHVSNGRADLICRSIGYDGVLRVEAEGFAGGIWLLWKTDLVVVTPIIMDPQHITVEITRNGDIPWVLSAIYASPDYYKRGQLWSALGDFARANSRPWLIGGDFNATLDRSERTYDSEYANRASATFAEWVDDSQLVDLGFSGPCFTWKYGTNMPTYRASRLDRFLCSDSWRWLFPEAVVQHVPTSHSDHCPLSLRSHPPEVATGNRPFRFLAAWTLSDNFKDIVSTSWSRENTPLSSCLSRLTEDLQTWNRRSFGNVFHKKRKLLARIEGVRRKLCVNPSSRLLILERHLCREFDVVLEQEQLIWFQKSRAKFLIEGDRNTRYYHLSTVVKRRANKILGLLDTEGQWVSNRAEVEKLVVDFFTRLYTADSANNSVVVIPTFSVSFPQLTESEVGRLSAPFSREDVWSALKSMSPYKSPGPDGFPALFYQQNWEVVGPKVTDAVLSYVNHGSSKELEGATVHELWDGSDWRWDVLEGVLHHEHLEMLRSYKLAPTGTIQDSVFWNKTPNGRFTTGSAMRILRGDDDLTPDPTWKLIWSIPCQQRIRQFLYFVVNQVVLCNQERQRRHMSPTEGCPRCTDTESLLHLLRDCLPIRRVWEEIGGSSLSTSFFNFTAVKDWVVHNTKNRDSWSTTFSYMIWHTWKCRNNLSFNGTDDILHLVHLVSTMAQTFRSSLTSLPAQPPQPLNNSQTSRAVQVAWSRPPEGWISLGVDGYAAGSPTRSGGGGVFRDHYGNFLSAFSFQCGSCEAFRAELWAVFHGIRRAKELGLTRVRVECDAGQVVQELQATGQVVHAHHALIKQCRAILSEAEEYKIVQVKRTANRVADCLATRCYEFEQFTLFSSVPSFLSHVLNSDYVASFEANSV
ncbi:hypothetical protein V2J09_007047 [Rumex salicifolius]